MMKNTNKRYKVAKASKRREAYTLYPQYYDDFNTAIANAENRALMQEADFGVYEFNELNTYELMCECIFCEGTNHNTVGWISHVEYI